MVKFDIVKEKEQYLAANIREKPFREPIAHMKSLGGSRTSNHGALWLYCKKTGPKKPKKFGVRGNALLNPIAISISHPYVAPRAGAWIETIHVLPMQRAQDRRPPCGGVD